MGAKTIQIRVKDGSDTHEAEVRLARFADRFAEPFEARTGKRRLLLADTDSTGHCEAIRRYSCHGGP